MADKLTNSCDYSTKRGTTVRHFVNDLDDLVSEGLDGTIISAHGALQRLDQDAPAPVALRSQLDPQHVALVSGGGSGHEPSHAGFVGEGLLSASVCGSVFASPSVDAVLAGILAVTGKAGCLLIVMNYTGDRLNFGLAAERARAMGHDVEMVVVADDIAMADAAQPRGIAGTLLVHKIAGHLAEQGKDLQTVAAAARDVADRVVSLGVARDTGTVPGNDAVDRIDAAEVEIGLGIHGEPGVETKTFKALSDLVEDMTQRLQTEIAHDGPIALLINDLGGTSALEMSAVTAAVAKTELGSRVELLLGPAAVMTSTDMPGFSLSALPLTDDDREALTSTTAVPSWPTAGVPVRLAEHVVSSPQMPASALESSTPSRNDDVRSLLELACQSCIDSKGELNDLDAKVGDGDTGSTFAHAARGVQERLDQLPLDDPEALCRSLSALMTQQMGGSSGVLLALFFEHTGEAVSDTDWPSALARGLHGMMDLGGADVGDRTMIDALSPAIEALQDGQGLQGAAEAARKGADGTQALGSAGAGRSAHVSQESLNGVTDPGAEAVARVLEAMSQGR